MRQVIEAKAPQTQIKREGRDTYLILLGALVFAILRSPILLFHGRVVAEEGTVYFQQAWDGRALTSLLALHQGYYSLLLNGVTLFAAKLVPLEWAAFTFTTAALLILLLTVYIAATCEEFQDTHSRLLAAAVVLLAPAFEVWLTFVVVQFYLILCVALICISNENRHRILRCSTLLLACLTGPGSCALTPFFLYRAYRKRTHAAAFQAAILVACSIVQAVAILAAMSAGERAVATSQKLAWFGPVLVMKIFSVTFLTQLGGYLMQRTVITHQSVAVCIFLWILCCGFLVFFWKMAKMGGHAAKMCFGMALFTLGFSYIGSIDPLPSLIGGAYRYFFAGTALFWMVLALAYIRTTSLSDRGKRKLARAALLLALFCGAVNVVGFWQRLQVLQPRWSTQVAAWRANPETPIHVFPAKWPATMHLRPH